MMYKEFLGSAIISLTIVSIFGNFHMVWTLMRKKLLRGKTGYIMGASSVFHVLTQLCFFGNIFFMKETTVAYCYPLAFVFIIVAYTLTVTVMVAAWDLFLNLVVPFRYSQIPVRRLLILYSCVIFMGFSLAVWFAIQGYLTTNYKRVITLCNPSLAMNKDLGAAYAMTINYTNICTFVVSLAAIALFFTRTKSTSSVQKRIIRNTLTMVVFFVCTFMAGNALLTFAVAASLSPAEQQLTRIGGFVLIMMAHGSDYYLCLWRSREYRQAFKEQMMMIFCRKPNKVHDWHGPTVSAKSVTMLQSRKSIHS